MLTFNEERHEYCWNGVVVPNVTRIISHLTDYGRIPPAVLERARIEGQHVHKMAEAHFLGTLRGVPEWMEGHYEALLVFVEETGFELLASEKKLYHLKMGYAGTADIFGVMPRLKDSKKPAVVDIKRSFYAGAAIGLQLVGYKDAANSDKKIGLPKIEERWGLKLQPNGRYKLEPFRDRDDEAAFLACLQQLRWKEKHYGSARNAA